MKSEFDNIMPWQVERYESLVKAKVSIYFDVDDFEEIIDHYVSRSLFNKALKISEYACQVHPSSIPLILKRAQLLASINKEDHALELLELVEDLEPSNSDVFLTRGAIYSQLRKYEQAIEEYNKAVFNSDEPDSVYCNIAFEYENMGNYDKTIEYLGKALELNPENDLAIFEAAYCFDMLSLTEESISFFQAIIDRHPYSIEAWFNLGVSYINTGRYEQAVEALDYAIAINDKHEHSWFHKGYALSLLGKFKEALVAYKQSLTEDDEADALKYYYIGECYEKMEDFVKAASYFRKTTRLDSHISDAWIGLGVCELETGTAAKAVKFMLKALEQDPTNTGYLCMVAEAYISNQQLDMAVDHYELAIESDNKDEEIWQDYSHALISDDRFSEAAALLARALDCLPDNVSLQYRMAACLFFDGKPKEGAFFLEEALMKDFNSHYKLLEEYPALALNPGFLQLVDFYRT
jgi:tetratricopeptide (TPR) repeat protein